MDRSEQTAAAVAADSTTSAGGKAEPARKRRPFGPRVPGPRVPVPAMANGGGYGKRRLPYREHKLPTGPRAWRHLKYRQYKKSSKLVIRKSAFEGLAREVAQDVDKDKIGYRLSASAMEVLQEGKEAELVLLFECSGKAMRAAKRGTLMQRDMHCVADVVNSFFPGRMPGTG